MVKGRSPYRTRKAGHRTGQKTGGCGDPPYKTGTSVLAEINFQPFDLMIFANIGLMHVKI
jgi:hypothetical protein